MLKAKTITINPDLPPATQEKIARTNERIILKHNAEVTKWISLVALSILGIVIVVGSLLLSSRKLETPEYLGVTFGSLTAIIGGSLVHEHGRAKGRQESLDNDD